METRRAHAQAELKVANKELLKVQDSIQAKTDELLKTRENALSERLPPLEKKLEQLIAQEEARRISVAEMDDLINDKQLTISGLNDVILSKNADITSLKTDITELKTSISPLVEKKSELNGQVNGLLQQISDLQVDKTRAENVLKDLSERKELASKGYEEFSVQNESIMIRKEQELARLDAKLLVTKQDEGMIRKIIDSESSALASRKVALDDRERVLRIREQKASIQENSIHQNAALLDL